MSPASGAPRPLKLLQFSNKNHFSSQLTASCWLSDRPDLSYPPTIETINLLEPSADFLAPGDRIHQVDGVSTVGLTNDQVMAMILHNRDENAVIEIEYLLPEYRECRSSLIDGGKFLSTNLFYFCQQSRKTVCASPRNWLKCESSARMDVLD